MYGLVDEALRLATCSHDGAAIISREVGGRQDIFSNSKEPKTV